MRNTAIRVRTAMQQWCAYRLQLYECVAQCHSRNVFLKDQLSQARPTPAPPPPVPRRLSCAVPRPPWAVWCSGPTDSGDNCHVTRPLAFLGW